MNEPTSPSAEIVPDALTIEERIGRTREIHAELRRLWGCRVPYDLHLALFPSLDLYEAVPIQELNATACPVKRIAGFGFDDLCTLHRPDAETGGAS